MRPSYFRFLATSFITIGLSLSLVSKWAVGQGALPKVAPAPADNPSSLAKIELGKQLFFDPRLSADGTISCQSCHNVMLSGEDNRPNSVGVRGQTGGRTSPTVWNAALMSTLFWDGRAATLEEQAKGPLTNPIEMGMKDHTAVVERLKVIPGYVAQFDAVFGKKSESLTIDNVAKAIATYERTLLTPSPYDRFVAGNKKALSVQAQRGLKLAQDSGCLSCHSGVNFAGPALPPGVPFLQKFPTYADNEYTQKYAFAQDLGRFEVTKKDEDKHFFRVPTWRNVALTAPYFHNGSVATLDEAVRVMAKTQLNLDLAPASVDDIVAFLSSLTGTLPKQSMPLLPPPVLGSSQKSTLSQRN